MDKKEKFLNLLSNVEPKINFYSKYFHSKFIRAFLVKEKSLVKIFFIFLKRVFKVDFKKRIKTFWDRDMMVYLADGDATSLYFFGILYGDEFNITKFLIKNLNFNDVFYDIGANYGFYTLLAQEFIKEGEIHSFEPNPKIFKLLKENSNLGKFKNTYINELALSDQNGEAEFYDLLDSRRHSGAGSLIKYERFKKYRVIKVKTIKLDDYVLNHKPPTIMKIDVEGAEPFVLKGGLNLIKNYTPLIIMEFIPDSLHLEAVKMLFDNKYSAYKLDVNGDLILVNKPKEMLSKNFNSERNYIFKK